MTTRKIFLDSSALYAFMDRTDTNYERVSKAMEQFSLQGASLFTNLQCAYETYNAINNQLGITLGFDFLQAMLESSIEILWPQKTDLIAAFRLIKLNRDKQLFLREALIAILMQKRGIPLILTCTYWNNLLGSSSYWNKF